ncbi:hypothetical protein EDC02_5915 [Micromonospora sp. Llam0]|uniref:hypothetical protein n=1 Tax=Micromonospora sp. Llam0 TaxID=2485143 RepID=UPI000F48AEEE|nr:hypothetical protein [Micromonospora sp. Llam0]ROO51051.1 hypothetical protein EDC02_5915 [Micromonospora sp. Llam0]
MASSPAEASALARIALHRMHNDLTLVTDAFQRGGNEDAARRLIAEQRADELNQALREVLAQLNRSCTGKPEDMPATADVDRWRALLAEQPAAD